MLVFIVVIVPSFLIYSKIEVDWSRLRPGQTRLGQAGVALWLVFSPCVFKAFTFFRMLTLFSCASLTSWASKDVVWSNMLEKDKAYTRDVHMMEKHPHLQPKMRAILLDWLMEVCGPSYDLQTCV